MESYHTTGQFARGDKMYYKHCGPTAMTNLVLTLGGGAGMTPEDVFQEVVSIGQRLGVYWNIRQTKQVGGTSDALSGLYLRQVLTHFGLAGYRVRAGGLATPAKLRAALSEGGIIYLQMHFHPKYRNHHVLVYRHDWQGFVAADGWRKAPTLLAEKDLRRASYFVIKP